MKQIYFQLKKKKKERKEEIKKSPVPEKTDKLWSASEKRPRRRKRKSMPFVYEMLHLWELLSHWL